MTASVPTEARTATTLAATTPIWEACDEGSSALLLTGRSLYDLVLDGGGRMRPLLEALRREAGAARRMHVITYSLAGGLDWDVSRLSDSADRTAVERALRAHRLVDVPQDQNEVVRVLRGISSLVRTPVDALRWNDGVPLRFFFLCEFGEHLAPGALTNGTQSDAQLVVSELAHVTAQSLALRTSGHVVAFHAREGMVDPLVCAALHHVRLPQPGRDEKRAFAATALALYTGARLEAGLDVADAAALTANTPNRGLERRFRASHRTARPVTARELTLQKSQDIERLSEGTLTMMDAARVAGVDLRGRMVQTPRDVLRRVAAGLRRGDARTASNLLLAGAPGTGKTDLAMLTAVEAGTAAYQLHSPKSQYVGETERLARLQQQMIQDTAPCVAFSDEIAEALPLERSSFDGDSGATRAVMATLLNALSDETRRGRSVIIGSTNCPWRLGDAMRSRFVIVPVLQPLAEDMPAIVCATARRVEPGAAFDEADPCVSRAARVFFDKGASAREIRRALAAIGLFRGALTPEALEEAAADLLPSSDRLSAEYADLWAIRACTSKALLPWSAEPQGFPYPAHLQVIVDRRTGDVDRVALERRLNELAPHVNV